MPYGLELCAIYSSGDTTLKIFKNHATEKVDMVMHENGNEARSMVLEMTPQSALFIADILKVRSESMLQEEDKKCLKIHNDT